MDPELGRFDPFSGQSGFVSGRQFQPPPLHMNWKGRKSKARRPCWPNFMANSRRTRPDLASKRGGGRHGGSPVFFVYQPFQAKSYLPPPIFGPFELIPMVLFSQIPHRLKDTTKGSLVDGWIMFSGHHNNFWTKVRVLLCS